MKNIFFGLLLTFISTETYAGCTLSFEKPYDSGMSVGFVSTKSHEKMIRILEGKGYAVETNPASRKTAEYVLSVSTSFGYGCGTGLTWIDYMMVPASFNVELSVNRGNVIFERAREYSLPVVIGGGTSFPKRKLMKAIRAIPKCEV